MEHFTWVTLIPGLNLLPAHSATALLVAAAIITWALAAKKQTEAAKDAVIPDGTLTARNTLEILIEYLIGVMEGVLGSRARQYLPLYGTFFLFIIVANLGGLLPGFTPPTSNFNVTFALGVTSFLMYNFYGFKEHGLAYLKHFVGPVPALAILMIPLELIDNFVRPVTLGLRLAANMSADHLVLGIFTDLTKVIIPVVFYMLGAFVCLVQTFVFTLLSLIYLSLSIARHGDHDAAHGQQPAHH